MKALLIFGGKSFEHDISIITAQIIYNKAKSSSFELLPVYIDKNDEWFYFTKDNMNITLFKDFEKTYKQKGFVRAYVKAGENYLYYKAGLVHRVQVDAALLCTHGGRGEDGHLTALLEEANIAPSVGSMTALGICMDKVSTKYALKGMKLPTIDFFDFTKDEFIIGKQAIFDRANKLGYPLIIKPASLGSSIGISVANNEAQLETGVQLALEFDEHLLVEKALLSGMEEYNVACMTHNGKTIVSPVDKPAREHQILSFEDKYIGHPDQKRPTKKQAGGYLAKKKFEKIDEKLEKRLKDYSQKVYEKLGLFGPVRIDFIREGSKIYINELNTIPGSLGYYFFVPYTFKTMGEYVDAILLNGKKRFEKEQNFKKEFITKLI